MEVADQAYRLQNGTIVPVTEVLAKSGSDPKANHNDLNPELQVVLNSAKSK
jgi:hypothetical protein